MNYSFVKNKTSKFAKWYWQFPSWLEERAEFFYSLSGLICFISSIIHYFFIFNDKFCLKTCDPCEYLGVFVVWFVIWLIGTFIAGVIICFPVGWILIALYHLILFTGFLISFILKPFSFVLKAFGFKKKIETKKMD